MTGSGANCLFGCEFTGFYFCYFYIFLEAVLGDNPYLLSVRNTLPNILD